MKYNVELTPTAEAELRQYIFKSHRIIFSVDDKAKIVRILYVRHGSMRAIGESESEG